MIEKLISISHGTARRLAWFGGTLLIAASVLVTIDVICRKLFNISLGGADEFTGYCFAVATSLSLSYALFERVHIRIDALYGFAGPRLRAAADLFGVALLTGFTALVAMMAWGLVADTLEYNSRSITPLKVPLAIPQIPWLIGWLFAVFSGVLLLVGAIARLRREGAEASSQLIGIKSTKETIEDEAGIRT
ncbi:TRAP transporter small permease subunit [Hoeflea sp.]|uniref:TRAP transporter small permease subunit n=1 Tax=Hoeflea sp. TaxID=1940281 RepID=UPI00374A6932